MVRGEKEDYYIAICNKTGAIAIYNESKNLFLSPSADGPITFKFNNDGTQNIINLSRFGRSFSILKVPYSFKLLMQELQIMNVQMRIITEDNVDQLTSMSYSDNINKLLRSTQSTQDTIRGIGDKISKSFQILRQPKIVNDIPESYPSSTEYIPTEVPINISSNSLPYAPNYSSEQLSSSNSLPNSLPNASEEEVLKEEVPTNVEEEELKEEELKEEEEPTNVEESIKEFIINPSILEVGANEELQEKTASDTETIETTTNTESDIKKITL
jgi:hypothetical protein